MFGVGVLLFGYDVSVIFLILVWCEFDDKNYDFDRVVLFVDLIWLKSIDFTGVWVIFSLGVLIIYNMKFCGLSAIFWVSSIRCVIYKDFDWFFSRIVVILRYF